MSLWAVSQAALCGFPLIGFPPLFAAFSYFQCVGQSLGHFCSFRFGVPTYVVSFKPFRDGAVDITFLKIGVRFASVAQVGGGHLILVPSSPHNLSPPAQNHV